MADPQALSILCELLCNRKPKERRAKDKPVESIFEKSPEYINAQLSDADGIPFIVKAVIASIYDTNAISESGFGKVDYAIKARSEIDRYGKIFSSHKGTFLSQLTF